MFGPHKSSLVEERRNYWSKENICMGVGIRILHIGRDISSPFGVLDRTAAQLATPPMHWNNHSFSWAWNGWVLIDLTQYLADACISRNSGYGDRLRWFHNSLPIWGWRSMGACMVNFGRQNEPLWRLTPRLVYLRLHTCLRFHMLLQPSILPAPFSDENLVLDITIYHHFSCLVGGTV